MSVIYHRETFLAQSVIAETIVPDLSQTEDEARVKPKLKSRGEAISW
jgi:hypothetical protein